MKNLTIYILIILLNFLLIKSVYSQYADPSMGLWCNENDTLLDLSGDSPYSYGGAYKPERVDLYPGTDSNSIFKILIVFIEFKNDSVDIYNSNWPSNVVGGNGPVYKDSLLSPTRHDDADWWNAYNENSQTLSDYWMEASRGKNHVVGNCYYIRLDSNANYYQNHNGVDRINSEIYSKLDATPGINWSSYDKWTYRNGNYHYESDGKIDMIYTVYRTYRPNLCGANDCLTPGSIAILYSTLQGDRYVVSSGDTIVAPPGQVIGHEYSGCTFTPGAACGGPCSPFSKDLFMTVEAHEIGHFHFGSCHASYGIMAGGGCYYFAGLDSWHSPWEKIKLGYGVPKTADFSTPNNYLGDFSSRNSNDTFQVLKVPISGSNEFFLIANRSKVSPYDRIMAGDTAHDNPFRDINSEIGKGIFIYHTPSGFGWYPQMDQECADGLYNWTQDGTQHPDWSNDQDVPYYVKTSVSYSNDNNQVSGNKDDKSIMNWFGIGKKHVTLGDDGTDKIYTNDVDVWTSRAWKGDRYDGWNVGYNEVFSPYSSPSSNTWNNTNSGIYIWLYSNSGSGPTNSAAFKIFKAGEGGYTDSTILLETPPSRPMGLRVLPCESQPIINSLKRIKLNWNHNMEPDMRRTITGETDKFKRYKIYRTAGEDINYVPDDALQYSENLYDYLATVDLNENSDPYFIDSGLVSGCNEALCGATSCWEMYPVRYRVQAVDIYDDVSVLSDFVNTEAWNTGEGEGSYHGDNLAVSENESNTGIPKEYSLNQNYPNPFNPVTKIKYDLPFDGNVSIKIFDISGRLIKNLINENKVAGRYEVDFHGENLSSGVYYYKIESGNFSQVRKMILIK